MIITIYKPDGTKERRPIGYTGGTCNTATAPYEALEIPGQLKKVVTAEGCEYIPVPVTELRRARFR
jgi:hypothetical protein